MKKVIVLIILILSFSLTYVEGSSEVFGYENIQVNNIINKANFPVDDYQIVTTVVPAKIIGSYENVTWYETINKGVYFDWIKIENDYNGWDYIAQGRYAVVSTYNVSTTNPTPLTNIIQYLRFNVSVKFEPTLNNNVIINFETVITCSKKYFYDFITNEITLLDNKASELTLTNNHLTFFTSQDQISKIETFSRTVDNPEDISFDNVNNKWMYKIISGAGSLIKDKVLEASGGEKIYNFFVAVKGLHDTLQEYQVELEKEEINDFVPYDETFQNDYNMESEDFNFTEFNINEPIRYCSPFIDPMDLIIYSDRYNSPVFYDFYKATYTVKSKYIDQKKLFLDFKFKLYGIEHSGSKTYDFYGSFDESQQNISFIYNYSNGYRAYEEDYVLMNENSPTTVVGQEFTYKYFKFKPEESRNYLIYNNSLTNAEIYIYNSNFIEIFNNRNSLNEPINILLDKNKTYYIHLYIKSSDTFDFVIIPSFDYGDAMLNIEYMGELKNYSQFNFYSFKGSGIFNFETYGNVKIEIYDGQFNLIQPLYYVSDGFHKIQKQNLYVYGRYFIKVLVDNPDSFYSYLFAMYRDGTSSPISITNIGFNSVNDILSNEEFKIYSFTANQEKKYIIETLGKANTYLKMYNSQGMLINEDDDSGDRSNSRLFVNLLENEVYYFILKMKKESQYNNYSILVSEIENMYHTEGTLNVINGSISYLGGTKYFKFSPNVSAYYKINTLDAVAGTTIEIRDEYGALLAYDDDSGFANLACITYYFEKNHDYYIFFYFDYEFLGYYELSISKLEVFSINWLNVNKRFYDGVEMAFIDNDFYVFTSILNPYNFDPINRTITFEKITCSWNTNKFPGPSYLIIAYIGERMFVGNYEVYYLHFECNNGYPDERSYIRNTWSYSAELFNVKIQFSQSEWDNCVSYIEL